MTEDLKTVSRASTCKSCGVALVVYVDDLRCEACELKFLRWLDQEEPTDPSVYVPQQDGVYFDDSEA